MTAATSLPAFEIPRFLPAARPWAPSSESPIARHRKPGRHRAQNVKVGDVHTLDFTSAGPFKITQPGLGRHRQQAEPIAASLMLKGIPGKAKAIAGGAKSKLGAVKTKVAAVRANRGAKSTGSQPSFRVPTPEDDHVRRTVAQQRGAPNVFETKSGTPASRPGVVPSQVPESWVIGQGDLGGNNVPMQDRPKPTADEKRSGLKKSVAGLAIIGVAAAGLFGLTKATNLFSSGPQPDGSSSSDTPTPTPSATPSPTQDPAPSSPVPTPAPTTPGQEPGAEPSVEAEADSPLVTALFNENPGVSTLAEAQELVRLYNDNPAAFVEAIRIQGTIVAGEENTTVTRNLLRAAGSRCAVDAAQINDLQQGADCISSAVWADVTGDRANLEFLRSVEATFYNQQAPDAASLDQLNSYLLSLN